MSFFTGLMSTARNDDELIEAVRFPCRAAGSMATRSASSRAGTAISPSLPARPLRTENGVRLAIGGVADRPDRARFRTSAATRSTTRSQDFAAELEARDDLHATADYRRDAGAPARPRHHRGGARCRA